MFEVFLHRVARRLHCGWLSIRGRLAFRRALATRDFTRPRRLYRELVAMQWTSFAGHLHLGLIAEHESDRELAFQELAVAYRLHAGRFRRAPIPKVLREGVLWRESLANDRPLFIGAAESTGREGLPIAGGLQRLEFESDDDHGPIAGEFSDFSSDDEAMRFSELPPIRPEDVASTDMDDLMERLLR